MRPLIAVIDTDVGTRQTLRALLGAANAEVTSYDTAESFLAAAATQSRAPVCLIADVHLPGMSGLQLLRHLRAAGNDAPFILLASEAEVPIAVEAMRVGATDFIEKSQLDVALLRRVSQLLRDGADRQAAKNLAQS
jgi:FixJ family two-component response regulator